MRRIALVLVLVLSAVFTAAAEARTYNPSLAPAPCDVRGVGSANVGIGNWIPNGIDWEGDLFCAGVPNVKHEKITLQLRYAGTYGHELPWQVIQQDVIEADAGVDHFGFTLQQVFDTVWEGGPDNEL